MLRITKNMYFGRQNPAWEIPGSRCMDLLGYIAQHRTGINEHVDIPVRGFQSFSVEIHDLGIVKNYGLPKNFFVMDGHAENNNLSKKIYNKIIEILEDHHPFSMCDSESYRAPFLYDGQTTRGSTTIHPTDHPLRITRNLFYGRNNPCWYPSIEQTKKILSYISQRHEGISTFFWPPIPDSQSMTVEILDENMEQQYKLPRTFRLLDGHARSNSISRKIMDQFIDAVDHESTLPSSATLSETCRIHYAYLTWDNRNWDTTRETFVHDRTHGSVINLAVYTPDPWNFAFVLGNNCYSYACNVVVRNSALHNWPHPGLCRARTAPVNDDELKRGLAEDGIVRLEPGMVPITGSNTFPAWIVAVATGYPKRAGGNKWDYHVLRKVSNGYGFSFWSHKPGASRIACKEVETGQLILDPEDEARKHGYNNFLGYYVVQNASVCVPH